jgi:hypothetical protein
VSRSDGARLVVLAVVLGAGVACTPTCEQTCRKLLRCELDDAPRVAYDECVVACESQDHLYEDAWQDEELEKAFDEHRRCIRDATCDEIADGACYDDALFFYDTDGG